MWLAKPLDPAFPARTLKQEPCLSQSHTKAAGYSLHVWHTGLGEEGERDFTHNPIRIGWKRATGAVMTGLGAVHKVPLPLIQGHTWKEQPVAFSLGLAAGRKPTGPARQELHFTTSCIPMSGPRLSPDNSPAPHSLLHLPPSHNQILHPNLLPWSQPPPSPNPFTPNLLPRPTTALDHLPKSWECTPPTHTQKLPTPDLNETEKN